MDEIELSLLHDGLVDLLAVLPCTIPPTGDRTLIQTKGMHNGLDRTPIGHERDHDHDQ
jgi:hypothetical protein